MSQPYTKVYVCAYIMQTRKLAAMGIRQYSNYLQLQIILCVHKFLEVCINPKMEVSNPSENGRFLARSGKQLCNDMWIINRLLLFVERFFIWRPQSLASIKHHQRSNTTNIITLSHNDVVVPGDRDAAKAATLIQANFRGYKTRHSLTPNKAPVKDWSRV